MLAEKSSSVPLQGVESDRSSLSTDKLNRSVQFKTCLNSSTDQSVLNTDIHRGSGRKRRKPKGFGERKKTISVQYFDASLVDSEFDKETIALLYRDPSKCPFGVDEDGDICVTPSRLTRRGKELYGFIRRKPTGFKLLLNGGLA